MGIGRDRFIMGQVRCLVKRMNGLTDYISEMGAVGNGKKIFFGVV
jgi:hypothetical protein